jgi:hypothetical protein
MYWMLLPPSANAERHLEPKTMPLRDFWIHKLNASWDIVLDLLAPGRRKADR